MSGQFPALTKKEREILNLSEEIRVLDGEVAFDFDGNNTELYFAALAIKKGFGVSRSGWPDFLVRMGDRTVGVEVKRGQDKVRRAQRVMFEMLEMGGIQVYVWDPMMPDKLMPWRSSDEARRRSWGRKGHMHGKKSAAPSAANYRSDSRRS